MLRKTVHNIDMAAGEIPTIPSDLMIQVENLAQQQGRPAADLIAEALKEYLDERAWKSLINSGVQNARSLGLTEEDVPRLITECRSEQRSGS
jgi:metal-responsive CopG/Arc/MetJ family transcriptional regulator